MAYPMAYDPMTRLTFEQMEELIAWYRNPEAGPDVLEFANGTDSGGGLQLSVDHAGVWIMPIP